MNCVSLVVQCLGVVVDTRTSFPPASIAIFYNKHTYYVSTNSTGNSEAKVAAEWIIS